MTEFLQMDVFFFITSAFVVVLVVLLVIAGVYVTKILRDIKYITRKAKSETELLSQDIDELRTNVRKEGAKIKHFGKFFSSIYKRTSK